MTKQVGFMRYVFFVEGVFFVSLSFLVARWGGLAAIIACSILCSTAFSGAYGIWRVSRFIEVPFGEVALGWLRPMFKVLMFYLPVAGLTPATRRWKRATASRRCACSRIHPVAGLTWWLLAPASGLTRLGINALLAGSFGIYLLLRFGIPGPFQDELLRRVPMRAVPILRRVFLQPAN